MVLSSDELARLDGYEPRQEGTRIVSLYDPSIQPLWAEIASRYGDGWIFPVLAEGRLVGAVEKWNMSGCLEVRSLDLDDPSLLPQALGALDDLMAYYRLVGYDIVRVKEVLGRATGDLPPETASALLAAGYQHIGQMYAKGRMLPRIMGKEEAISYVLQKQHVSGRRYENMLAAVKRMGGLRSDGEAFLRCKVKVPLKKLAEQGMLFRVLAVPEFSTYTTLDHASLYRAARGIDLDKDARSLLGIIEDHKTISRRRLYDLSPVGERRTYDAIRRLHLGSCICLDGANRYKAVPASKLSAPQARKEVVRLLFRNFGLMSAENLSRFMKFEMRMREIRTILAELEDEGFLVKGFLIEGDETVHWMLRKDADRPIKPAVEEFVLTPMDNLSYFLYPQIRERFGTWSYVVFRGPEMIGSFRARKKGKDLYLMEPIGDREMKKLITQHVRLLGMTIREGQPSDAPDWDTLEFYERTHPGEPRE